MSTLPTLLFAVALPKRFRPIHRLRNMNRAEIAVVLYYMAGPVICFILSLLTLLIP